ncbi:AAC(3) family N-acetyltransferase [Natronococcus pandeyae]|nr:AAC(3) family N-acetyltransferase [Natronococcus pandeyae]
MEQDFINILEKYGCNEKEIFVHTGLSDIQAAFDTNPYQFLIENLSDNFESILAPGFTDYFRTSGIYHMKYSRPKHGVFGKLFLHDSDYRTEDPIKSILVKGSYRFEGCDHRDSYSPNGCFAKLVNDNILVMNVGTPWIVCSLLHYFESKYNADYMKDTISDGIIYKGETEYKKVSQKCGEYTSEYYSWNKPKIEKLLVKEGVLDRYDLNGLKLRFFKLKDMEKVLAKKLRSDPYYLVKI